MCVYISLQSCFTFQLLFSISNTYSIFFSPEFCCYLLGGRKKKICALNMRRRKYNECLLKIDPLVDYLNQKTTEQIFEPKRA